VTPPVPGFIVGNTDVLSLLVADTLGLAETMPVALFKFIDEEVYVDLGRTE
jgi:hypothetical protein